MLKGVSCVIIACVLSAKLAAAGAVPDANILYDENFKTLNLSSDPEKGWKANNISAEQINDCMRIREVGPKSYGSIVRYVPFRKDMNYLQIKLGEIENIIYNAKADNASSGGQSLGPLFSGWNTFNLDARNFARESGTFALAVTQFGPNGTPAGGWLDIKQVRVVKIPYGGLTMELKAADVKPAQSAKVGDRIVFRYYAAARLPEDKIAVKCYYQKWMETVKFSNQEILLTDDGKNGDEQAGDCIYSAAITIDRDATALKSEAKECAVIAKAVVNGEATYAVPSFAFDLQTANELERKNIIAGTPLTRENRTLWMERTRGENLARGRKVKFSIAPDYRLTSAGNTDETDLTDGRLADMNDDRIWFSKDTVGWYQGAGKGVNFMLDLGNTEPVGDLVVRCLAGQPQPALASPKKLEAFVSSDGKNFYRVASMEKLMPAEKNQSDFKNFYFLPENGEAYVYPFVLKINSNARYIVLRLTGVTGFLCTDELVVLKAQNADGSFNEVYTKKPTPMFSSGLVVIPRDSELVVSRNIITPDFLEIQDMRTGEDSGKPFTLVMELPAGLRPLNSKAKSTPVDSNMFKWELPGMKAEVPVYIKAETAVPEQAHAVFYAEYKNVPPNKLNVPVKLIDIPQVPALKRLHVSLVWMTEDNALNYPEFFNSWQSMGFNAVGTFPRYWNDTNRQAMKQFVADARQHGMSIIINSTPTWGYGGLRLPPGAEIYSQTPDGKSKNICPSYFGKYYPAELARIEGEVKQVNPDYVWWDIECWHGGIAEAARCERCLAEAKAAGKDMNDFLEDCGTRQMKDFYEIVKKAAGGGKMPVVATYDNEPLEPQYQMYNFNKIYPAYIQQAHPSLYVAGNAERVHNSVRGNYKLMKNRNIIPWLTAGTYGEFDSFKIEQMILEALLNGAGGITYFQFSDFDTPQDFFYHAKALAEIAPYEDLIMDGEVLEPAGSNKELIYSGVKKANEMLLLIGNYRKVKDTGTIIELPMESVSQIKDLRSGQLLKSERTLKIDVPAGEIRLLHIKS